MSPTRKTRAPDFRSIVMIYSVFFPWLSLSTNNMDSQPWPLLASLFFLFSKGSFFADAFCKIVSFLILLSIFVILLINYFNFNSASSFLVMRSIAGYISIALIYIVFFNIKLLRIDIKKHIILINWIWILISVVQLIFGPYLFDWAVHVRTSPSRGVTSLAPEPTFFAMFLIVISWIIIYEFRGKRSIVANGTVIANLITIIFIAKSSMAILYVGVIFILWLVFGEASYRKKLLIAISTITLAPFLFIVAILVAPESRFVDLIYDVIDSPASLITKDLSINDRFSYVYFSFYGFVDGALLPRGVGAFAEYAKFMNGHWKDLFIRLPGSIILSWSGALLFELGVLGLCIFLIVLTIIYKGAGQGYRWLSVAVFLTISIAAIPHGFAPLAALIGLHAAGGAETPLSIASKT
jgi:hypothetical protein